MLIVTEYDKHNRGTGKQVVFKDQNAARIFCESKGRGSWMLNNQYYEVRQGGERVKSYTISPAI